MPVVVEIFYCQLIQIIIMMFRVVAHKIQNFIYKISYLLYYLFSYFYTPHMSNFALEI